jgi:hypothetical protein
MTRPVIALVTGFTRNGDLCRRSLAPLCMLKRRGMLDRILAVTWDSAALDEFVTPLGEMPEVELVRVPEPKLTGAAYRKGTIFQLRNLEAALALVPESDALIFKARPDFVADAGFLAGKIANFDRLCAPSTLPYTFGTDMPDSPFDMKIWLPWADANQPFFYEDGAFMGLKRDVAKLADRNAETYLDILEDRRFGWFAHIVRFALPFLDSHPIFRRYLRDFHCFPNDTDFRVAMLRAVNEDPFFWHLLIAHAWILATSFHVDCGAPGQLGLYTNIYNQQADWTKIETLKVNPPYDTVNDWRAGQHPGGLLPGAGRVYGRLMDDSWQEALFTQARLADLSPDDIRGVLRNVTLYSRGLLAEAEQNYYGALETLCRVRGFSMAAREPEKIAV